MHGILRENTVGQGNPPRPGLTDHHRQQACGQLVGGQVQDALACIQVRGPRILGHGIAGSSKNLPQFGDRPSGVGVGEIGGRHRTEDAAAAHRSRDGFIELLPILAAARAPIMRGGDPGAGVQGTF